MNDLLSDDILAKLVGVIDLRRGQAVHAIAGDRDRYRPVDLTDGNPVALAAWYRKLGVTDLYVADLDAILDGQVQVDVIDAVCRGVVSRSVLVDLGWVGKEKVESCHAVDVLAERHSNISWIAATESAGTIGAVTEIAELVSPQRVFVGLDYRNGQLIADEGNEAEWIDAAIKLECCGVVILDLASVGTASGPSTTEICRRIKRQAARLSVYSGGGVRTAQDVQALIDAGCDRCLVATALQG